MQTAIDRRQANATSSTPSGTPPTSRRKFGLVLVVGAALVAMAIGLFAVTGGSPATHPSVKAGLREWAVTFDQTILSRGTYTFKIANDGKVEHELIAFRTSLSPGALPTAADGRINEEDPALVSATDGPNLKPGQTTSRTVDLTTPGTYVFMCNLPAHYGLGMHTVVTVS